MGLLGADREEMLPHVSEQERQRVAELDTRFAGKPGGLSAAAIRFCLQPEEVSVVLSGASAPEQIDQVIEWSVRTPR